MKRLLHMRSLALAILLLGCGGGNNGVGSLLSGGNDSSGGDEQTMTFGSLTTRVTGTVEPPVAANNAGATVQGVAGGSITSLIRHPGASGASGSKLVFMTDRDGNYEIYTMNPDGSSPTRLTNNSAYDSHPRWSPDGSKIAFASERDGSSDIFVMNADGSDPVNLTNHPTHDILPAWSPDGTKIAFETWRFGNTEIGVMNADGSNVRNLTNNGAYETAPDWSPDGTKIAFLSKRDDGSGDVYVMNADGSNQTRLTTTPGQDNVPTWSPDGTKIAFISERDGNFEIYVMNANGSNQTRLTNNPASDSYPFWSPDGTKIAFDSNRDGNWNIYMMNANGSNVQQVTNAPATDTYAHWSSSHQGPGPQTLIGPGGLLGTSAAGFVFGQSGNTLTSVVALDCMPRKPARVAALTGTNNNGPNILMNITGDSLTRIAFVNGNATSATAILSAATAPPTTGASVSFNSRGEVAAILLYATNRTAEAPVTEQNGVRVLRGHYRAAYDASGKNLAPNGATEIHLDARSGAILRVK